MDQHTPAPAYAPEQPTRQSFWKAALKSLGFVALFEGAQFVAAFLGELALAIRAGADGMLGQDLMDFLYTAYLSRLYEIMFLSVLLFFGVILVIYAVRPRSFFEATGLQKTTPLSCVAGVFLGMGAFLLAGLLVQLTQLIPQVAQSAEGYMEQMEEIEKAGGRAWVEILYTCLGAPVIEEVLCRGLVLRELNRATSRKTAVLLSGLVFAVIHGNLYQFIFTFPLGVLLGYLAVTFGSVLPSIFLHAAFNSSNYLLILGEYFGFGEEDPAYLFILYAVEALCLFSIPIGIFLLRLAHDGLPKIPDRVAQDFRQAASAPMRDMIFETEGGQMAPEFLVVGLGNPGEKYASTRHNAGFIALDYLAIREGLDFSRARFRALTAEKSINGRKVLFLKPQTFMNLSGESVREAAAFYRIAPERILVIYDDVNFEPGEMRIRKDGGAGGHNGMKSIISCLGTDLFPRVRLGVGKVPEGRDLVGWVLGNLPDGDMDKLVASLEGVNQTVKSFVAGDLDRAMNQYNQRTN